MFASHICLLSLIWLKFYYTITGFYSYNYYFLVRYNDWNTVPAKARNPDFEKWNATIATTFYPLSNDIHVVFEHRNTYSSYYVKYTGREYEVM